MFSILIINLLLEHFDNKLFFDEEYIKFLKYKNSFIQIKHQTIEPNYKFYKRITPEYKEDNKIKLLNYNLMKISERLTQEQIFYARRNRNWEKYDKLSEVEKSQILVEVYGGNWCSDTHAGVPELCKVLDLCGITSYNFEYHRVSRDKLLVDGQSRSFEITSVPLIRVYKFDSEGQRSLLGEIVEMPRVSWEVDLLKILTK